MQLDKYFHERAGQDQRRNVANCFVMVHSPNDEIVGFYTLSASLQAFTDLPEHLSRRLPRYPNLPAILLGRLAVATEHQGKGYGRLLLMDALQRAREATRHIAAFTVVVDAKDEAAIAFYERLGFVRFSSSPNRLFFPIASVP